jgi:hypothetical protein
MKRNLIVLTVAIVAMVFVPLANGQPPLNINTANTSGGCPTVWTSYDGTQIVQQCTMANAMAGIDPNDSTQHWQTVFPFFNRDHVIHSGTQQTFVPDGGALFPMTWTWPNGGSEVVPIEFTGATIAPLGSAKAVITPSTPDITATPFAVTSLSLRASDGLPDLIGEILVEKMDANGNVKTAYTSVDAATITAIPQTSWAVQLDTGYSDEDTLITFLNPDRSPATVTVSFWNGYNDQPNFATREATEVYATTTITVPAAEGGPGRRPFIARRPPVEGPAKGRATLDVGSFCSQDVACSGYLNNPANDWKPNNAGPGTASLAVISSSSPVQVQLVRVINNPDGSSVAVGAYAFPLIPQQ